MTKEQQPSKTRTKKKTSEKSDDEIDFNKPTRVDKIGFYLLLVSGLLVLIGGLDMTYAGSESVGWSPGGRFSSGTKGSINGPTAIVFGVILLISPVFSLIKKYINKTVDT